MPKRIVYHKYFCDDDFGEADGFFEIIKGKLKFVSGWYANDAQWRIEYMGGLLNHFGITVEELPEKHDNNALILIKKNLGVYW